MESYTENAYNIDRRVGWDRYLGSSLNATKKFATAAPSYLKAGLRWRNQTRRLGSTNYRGVYVGPDGVMGPNPATEVNDDNLAQFGQANQPLPTPSCPLSHPPSPSVLQSRQQPRRRRPTEHAAVFSRQHRL